MNIDLKASVQKVASAAPMLAEIARTESFTKAAENLGIQQSGVSHKIRTLEAALGFALFVRTTRKVELTRQGSVICKACETSVDAISAALQEAKRLGNSGTMVLSLPSSLAMKWLVPAMKRAHYRKLAITLNIEDELATLGQGGSSDAAIRFGVGPYPGFHTRLLSKCEVMSVSSKMLAPHLQPATGKRTVLLRDTTAEEDGTGLMWESYLGATLDNKKFDTTMKFGRSDIALQAAIGGLGHSLGRTLLVENDLDAGLLQISGPLVPIDARYWIVTTPDFAMTDSYSNLSDWLLSEVKRSNAMMNR